MAEGTLENRLFTYNESHSVCISVGVGGAAHFTNGNRVKLLGRTVYF